MPTTVMLPKPIVPTNEVSGSSVLRDSEVDYHSSKVIRPTGAPLPGYTTSSSEAEHVCQQRFAGQQFLHRQHHRVHKLEDDSPETTTLDSDASPCQLYSRTGFATPPGTISTETTICVKDATPLGRAIYSLFESDVSAFGTSDTASKVDEATRTDPKPVPCVSSSSGSVASGLDFSAQRHAPCRSQLHYSRSGTILVDDSDAPEEHYPLSVVVAAILAYGLVSVSIVYLNWWVFTSSFRYPLVVSWIQQCVGLVAYYVASCLGRFGCIRMFQIFPLQLPHLAVAFKVLPLTLAFVCMVGSANVCLRYVQVSTYQVARSLTLITTGVLSHILLNQVLSCKIILACGVVVLGFIVGALDPTTLTFLGVLFGVTSSVFQGLYNVMIKTSLEYVNGNTNVMLLYNLTMSSVLFLPIIALSDEYKAFHRLPKEFSAWAGIFGSGCLATLLNLVSYNCVKVTSPLTFNVVGMCKACVQSAGGIIFFGDRVSVNSLVGIILTLVGSGWYSQVKLKEREELTKQWGRKSSFSAMHRNGACQSEYREDDIEQRLGNSNASRLPTDSEPPRLAAATVDQTKVPSRIRWAATSGKGELTSGTGELSSPESTRNKATFFSRRAAGEIPDGDFATDASVATDEKQSLLAAHAVTDSIRVQ